MPLPQYMIYFEKYIDIVIKTTWYQFGHWQIDQQDRRKIQPQVFSKTWYMAKHGI